MPPNLLTTALAAIRYPSAANNGANFAAGIEDMAEDLDVLVPGAPVASLPSSPTDGQVVHFQNAAMAAKGLRWPLVYNENSALSKKWEAAGCTPWHERVDTQQSTTSSTYTNLSTDGPKITAPLAGVYLARFGVAVVDGLEPAGGFGVVGIKIGSGAEVDVISSGVQHSGTGGSVSDAATCAGEIEVSVPTGGTDVKLRYKSGTGITMGFALRWLSLTPISVG